MPIVIKCPACGKRLKAPDSAAGRGAKCPACGQAMRLPEPVYNAEEVVDEPGFSDEFGYDDDGDYGGHGAGDFPDFDADEYDSPALPDRRPCPMCGEMIVATAARCRFCGEVFDDVLKRSKSLGRRGRRVDKELVRKFRREMHGLGGFWIFIGALAFIAGIVIAAAGAGAAGVEPALGVVAVVLGAGWIGIGVFTCLKHAWAVYVGLVLSYLSLLGNLINLNICPLVILIIVIVQAHRCIKWMGQMRDAGVPLTAKA